MVNTTEGIESVARPTLKDLRVAAGLTQVALAERANLSEFTLLKLEAGLHAPTLDTLGALARVLGPEVMQARFGWKRPPLRKRGRPARNRDDAETTESVERGE